MSNGNVSWWRRVFGEKARQSVGGGASDQRTVGRLLKKINRCESGIMDLDDKTIETLGKIKDPQAVAPLIDLFRRRAAWETNVCAAAPFCQIREALANIGGTTVIETLLTCLNDRDPFVRRLAMLVLSDLKEPRVVAHILLAVAASEKRGDWDEVLFEALVAMLKATGCGPVRSALVQIESQLDAGDLYLSTIIAGRALLWIPVSTDVIGLIAEFRPLLVDRNLLVSALAHDSSAIRKEAALVLAEFASKPGRIETEDDANARKKLLQQAQDVLAGFRE